MKMTYSTNEDKVCCNCRHNIRMRNNDGAFLRTVCEMDGHYIDYIECMTMRCRHWAKEKEVTECSR